MREELKHSAVTYLTGEWQCCKWLGTVLTVTDNGIHYWPTTALTFNELSHYEFHKMSVKVQNCPQKNRTAQK